MTVWVGVDPGNSGGIAIINGKDINIIPMPYTLTSGTNKKKINKLVVNDIFESFKNEPHFMVIEIQQALRKPIFGVVQDTNEKVMIDRGDVQGTSSTFNTGYGFGILLGLATAHRLNYECVGSQKWQGVVFPKVRHQGTKATSIEIAKQLYPNVSLKLNPDNKREKTDKNGLSDALLIATYAMLSYNSESNLYTRKPAIL